MDIISCTYQRPVWRDVWEARVSFAQVPETSLSAMTHRECGYVKVGLRRNVLWTRGVRIGLHA